MPLLLLTYCTVTHHRNGSPFPSFRSVSLAGIVGFFGVLRIASSSSTVDQFSTSGNFPTLSKSPQPPCATHLPQISQHIKLFVLCSEGEPHRTSTAHRPFTLAHRPKSLIIVGHCHYASSSPTPPSIMLSFESCQKHSSFRRNRSCH
ncbi:hypothetical protein DY000_02033045 [Brassica cretica]|uniref:Uncharacterized protein n=1 Tax=Brassica cretica TaxID=69181 RepID=A0ABQ7DWF7_BRACR|nr:hypothetical protein DY000_02033045 [Brassica cretica]